MIVSNCSNRAVINGYGYVGGIIGKYLDANYSKNINKILNCYNIGEITATTNYVAGIVGAATLTTTYIKEVYNIGDINGMNHVGGIAGNTEYYADSTKELEIDAMISNFYNRGDITCGYHNAGGIVGYNGVELTNGYNTGNVIWLDESKINIGIVAGQNRSEISNVYYLKKDDITSCGKNNGTILVYERTKEQMKNTETFVEELGEAFIIDIDNFNEGYPILRKENKSLKQIIVTNIPDKTTYIEGENFDKKGMIVTAKYDDGSTKIVTDYKILDGNNLTVDKISVIISYTENNVTKTTTQDITVFEKLEIDLGIYEEKQQGTNKYIVNVNPQTTIKQILENIGTNGSIEIYGGTIKITDLNKKVETGMTLKVILNNQQLKYAIVVTGDTNSDGHVDIKDILAINKHRLNKVSLTIECLLAGDVNKDGQSDIKDILQINKFRLGKISEL